MKITKEQEKMHDSLTVCKDCNCKFSEENNKVHHHDHINEQHISTICNICNLKYKYKYFLPFLCGISELSMRNNSLNYYS